VFPTHKKRERLLGKEKWKNVSPFLPIGTEKRENKGEGGKGVKPFHILTQEKKRVKTTTRKK